MDEDTINKLKEQFKTLPKEVQQAILNTDLSTKLQQIIKNNQLMIDQAGILEIETMLVLYGIEPLESYKANIARELNLSNEKAFAVARDVDELIFKSIRENLRKINEEIKNSEKETPVAAPVVEKEQTIPITPSKEETLEAIENPKEITKEQSISLSSLESNTNKEKAPDETFHGIEIRKEILPEIAPEVSLPVKVAMPYHENISPVENIVQTKMTETVAVPKQTIVVEEKAKLPEKPKVDSYREPIN